jgi:hypothetical protein
VKVVFTSAENMVLISPMLFIPAKNGICKTSSSSGKILDGWRRICMYNELLVSQHICPIDSSNSETLTQNDAALTKKKLHKTCTLEKRLFSIF